MPTLRVSRENAREQILKQFEKGREIADRRIQTQDDLFNARRSRDRWTEYNKELLKVLFEDQTVYKSIYERGSGGAFLVGTDLAYRIDEFRDDVLREANLLKSVTERLELYDEPKALEPVIESERKDGLQRTSNSIFIVHGHDEAAKEKVARYITTLGPTPIILHEHAAGGRTIIEKIEHYSSDVGFAIILLTPDDLGKAENDKDLQPRARQNVVLELGYFAAKLGRSRVCALNAGVEVPTDFSGVEYITFDKSEAWKMALGRELQEAGYKLDLSRLFS